MRKFLFIAALIIILSAVILTAVIFSRRHQNSSDGIKIITTLYPLYDFAKNVAGDKAHVSLLLPPGIESHSFEPTPRDIVNINNADIFIFTGKFMEPWAADIIGGINNKKNIVVDASKGIQLITSSRLHQHHENQSHEHHQHESDPHIWLDFDNDKIIIDSITEALCQADPVNSDFYIKNADEYKNQLTIIDNEYKAQLEKCQSRTIVFGGHYAFGYMAKRYNLNYLAAQGFSPDSEPTTSELISLVNQIRKDNIQYIFYEELASPKTAETLANETNAKMLLLNAGHNVTKADIENNVSFISIMRKNLENLKIGLQCN